MLSENWLGLGLGLGIGLGLTIALGLGLVVDVVGELVDDDAG